MIFSTNICIRLITNPKCFNVTGSMCYTLMKIVFQEECSVQRQKINVPVTFQDKDSWNL